MSPATPNVSWWLVLVEIVLRQPSHLIQVRRAFQEWETQACPREKAGPPSGVNEAKELGGCPEGAQLELSDESGNKVIPKAPPAVIFWENTWVTSLMEGKV